MGYVPFNTEIGIASYGTFDASNSMYNARLD